MLILNSHVVRCASTSALLSWTLVAVQSVRAQDDKDLSGALPLPPAIHATRLDYSEFDAPEAVTVITQDDIRLAGYLEISEIFRSVPGFRILKIGDESRLSYHGTNGTQNRRMLITVDGRSVLIGDGQYVEFDRLPIELEDIARVTVTRGPNGAAYGDNAFLASIDFQTVGRDDPHGTTLRLGAGYNERRKSSASGNYEVGDYSVQLSIGAEHDGGYDFFADGRTPRDDGKDTARARLAVEREFTEGSVWRFDANGYDGENKTGIRALRLSGKQENDGSFFALSNTRELGEASRFDWIVSRNDQYEAIRNFGCFTPDTIAGARLVVTDPAQQAALLAPTRVLPSLLRAPLENVCFFNDIAVDSDRTELQMEYESRRGPWRYLLGGSGSEANASSAQRFAGQDQRQRSYRVFGETDVTFGSMHASLGYMVQDSSNVESTESAWRGAVNWQFSTNQALRYSFAHSFRVPSLIESETFWTGEFSFGLRDTPLSTYQIIIPLPLVTNSTRVEPETIDSHALGYFGTFLRSSATVDVKVFQESIRDPIESSVFYFSTPPFNGRTFRQRGAETELAARLTEQWKVSGHYSYLDTDAQIPLERGLHGDHAGSLLVTYRPSSAHAITIGYYGNSTISGNSYDRYDLVYNYSRSFGQRVFRSQLIFNHHVGGRDGLREDVAFLSNEGRFAHLNQFFLFAELTF